MAKGEANRFGNGREINARLWVADDGIISPPLTNIFWNVFIFPLSQSAKYLPIPQAEKSKLEGEEIEWQSFPPRSLDKESVRTTLDLWLSGALIRISDTHSSFPLYYFSVILALFSLCAHRCVVSFERPLRQRE